MICGKLYLRNVFCKFVLCSKCVYFVVFTREMIVYVCILVYRPGFFSRLVSVCA